MDLSYTKANVAMIAGVDSKSFMVREFIPGSKEESQAPIGDQGTCNVFL